LLPEIYAHCPLPPLPTTKQWPSSVDSPSTPSPPSASVAEEASEGEGKDEAKAASASGADEEEGGVFSARSRTTAAAAAADDDRKQPPQPGTSTPIRGHADALVAAARVKGLLVGPDPSPTPPHADVRALDSGLRREFVTVVAVKIVGQNSEHECAINNHGVDVVHELLDALAARHKVVRCRRLGDLWIGSVGFFDHWGSDRLNSFHALQFAGEAMWFSTKLRLRMCCAVECGAVDGGVLSGSPFFDMYGSDVRWVLRMVEARQYGYVLVGRAVRGMHGRGRDGVGSEIRFERVPLHATWARPKHHKVPLYTFLRPLSRPLPSVQFWPPAHRLSPALSHAYKRLTLKFPCTCGGQEKVYFVVNPAVLVPSESEAFMLHTYCVEEGGVLNEAALAAAPGYLDWVSAQKALSERNPSSDPSSSSSTTGTGTATATAAATVGGTRTSLFDELGHEFQTSVHERFGLSLQVQHTGRPSSVPYLHLASRSSTYHPPPSPSPSSS
jgi:hypothetical protein